MLPMSMSLDGFIAGTQRQRRAGSRRRRGALHEWRHAFSSRSACRVAGQRSSSCPHARVSQKRQMRRASERLDTACATSTSEISANAPRCSPSSGPMASCSACSRARRMRWHALRPAAVSWTSARRASEGSGWRRTSPSATSASMIRTALAVRPAVDRSECGRAGAPATSRLLR